MFNWNVAVFAEDHEPGCEWETVEETEQYLQEKCGDSMARIRSKPIDDSIVYVEAPEKKENPIQEFKDKVEEAPKIAEKVEKTGNKNIFLCERGTSFGYNNLVSDMRSLPILRKLGYPVIFDATHSVQQPGGLGSSSGGQREFAPVLAKAAVAVGVAGVFMETHQDPDNAPSDGPNMIKITEMRDLISLLLEIDIVTKRSMGDM